MKIAQVTFLFILEISSISVRFVNLLLGVRKKFTNVLLALPDKLIQDLGSVDDLWFFGIEHFPDLSSHQSLSSARRSVK